MNEQIMIMGENNATTIDYVDYSFTENIPQSYSILRATFNDWFAGEAENQGALIAPGILVEDLIEKDGRVIGIKAGDDEIYADIVIAADGVNSFLAKKAGLRNDIKATEIGVGAKEVIELPNKIIEDRFNLNKNEGTARVLVGCAGDVLGGGFLYTNKNSISLGVVLSPTDLARHKVSITEYMQNLKMHPAIYPLIKDGKTVEYGGHLVPEIGFSGMPQQLYKNGFLVVGDAAGMVINTGTIIRGIDLAIISGIAAANAILSSESVENIGRTYIKELEALQLLPTMKLYANFHTLLENRRMIATYPNMANDMIKSLFEVDGKVSPKINKNMLGILKKHVSFKELLFDGWRGARVL